MPDFPFNKLPQTSLTHTISREFPNQYLVKMIPGRISDEICIYKIRPERRLFRTKLVKSYLMPVIAAEAVLQGIDLTGPDYLMALGQFAIESHEREEDIRQNNSEKQAEAERYFVTR